MIKLFVDNARIKRRVGGLQAVWCHLYVGKPWLPIERERLHEFAKSQALVGGFQEHSHIPHYLVTVNQAKKLLKEGVAHQGSDDQQRGMIREMAKTVEICSCCFGLTTVANTRRFLEVPVCLSCLHGVAISQRQLQWVKAHP